MATLQKQLVKNDKAHRILFGLIRLYIATGKPIGSNTLRENGFHEISSATIRNYFAYLEQSGFLTQAHASGGRIPTAEAFKLFAIEVLEEPLSQTTLPLGTLPSIIDKEIAPFLQQCAELLADVSECTVFLSAPRFDQDFIADIKLVGLDLYRAITIIVTEFGQIQTEIIQLPKKFSLSSIRRVEEYLQLRLRNQNEELRQPLHSEEMALGQKVYRELLLRYITHYSNFLEYDLYRTGISHLLHYPEFQESSSLVNVLAFFENQRQVQNLLQKGQDAGKLSLLIGEELQEVAPNISNCATIVAPYFIHNQVAGAIALLGPVRLDYCSMLGTIRTIADYIGKMVTQAVYKFKITYRLPDPCLISSDQEKPLLYRSPLMLLEDQRKTF